MHVRKYLRYRFLFIYQGLTWFCFPLYPFDWEPGLQLFRHPLHFKMSYFPPPQLRVAAASKVEAEAKKPQTFLFHDLYDGHMPNHWGVSIPGQVGQGRKEAHYICG
jgi:hypothetical protein